MARQKHQKSLQIQQRIIQKKNNSWLKKLFAFLIASGIFFTLLKVSYQYFMGNIYLEFVQPVGRSYEFQFKNDTPADFTVRKLRIEPPRTQDVVYTFTEDVYVTKDNQGNILFPGGNLIYVPAAEFKELDGQAILANTSLKFRVPPLASRSWIKPEAVIVKVYYDLEPSNSVLSKFENILHSIGIYSRAHSIRYLVIDNYWMVSSSTSIHEAISIFCRDNDLMANLSVCINLQ